jgi:putative Holliday junction resolvase
MQATPSTLLALDVGAKRIGVAIADTRSRLPRPFTTLENNGEIQDQIAHMLRDQQAFVLVVGLPRGLEGQETAQTAAVRDFADSLRPGLPAGLQMHWQDEALTSVKPEEELVRRGKPFKKGDIDALSATYILEDFLRDHPTLEYAEVTA